MIDLPKFERSPILPQKEEEDKEIWQPSWRCFCCQDTGQIQRHLIELIIPDFDPNRDRIPVCQACNKFDNYHLKEYGVLDLRFDLYLCKKLDAISRADWKQITRQQFEVAKKRVGLVTDEVAQAHSLRKSKRTQNDNREVQQHKAEIEAKEYAAAVGGDDE
ncbi:hypothetical protein VB735_33805 [Halotia wernerae UHCC 0503]|nr:hypothetical protein [Halotia wernerae UHCC 0503]